MGVCHPQQVGNRQFRSVKIVLRTVEIQGRQYEVDALELLMQLEGKSCISYFLEVHELEANARAARAAWSATRAQGCERMYSWSVHKVMCHCERRLRKQHQSFITNLPMRFEGKMVMRD